MTDKKEQPKSIDDVLRTVQDVSGALSRQDYAVALYLIDNMPAGVKTDGLYAAVGLSAENFKPKDVEYGPLAQRFVDYCASQSKYLKQDYAKQ